MNNERVNESQASSIQLPVTRRLWVWCIGLGAALWIVAVFLWTEGSVDQIALFHFNDARIAGDDILVMISQWLSSYGMTAISILYVLYWLASYKVETLDAPKAINFFVICSFGISGIAGDLLKIVISRPRPIAVYPEVLTVLSDASSHAMPSGHATKAMALAVPFVLLVSNKSIGNKVVKILVSLIAIGVVVSRVILGAHYVSDVVGGMGMAILGLPITMLFTNMVVGHVSAEKLPRMRIVWGVLLLALAIIFRLI